MNHRLTLAQYRTVDLALFAAILCVTESVIVLAGAFWFPDELFTVSVSASVCAIVLMRWGPWAGIHAALSGFVFCLVSGGTLRQYAVYIVGNLACLAMVPVLRSAGPEKIRKDKLLAVLFGAAVQLLMQLGRALVALISGSALTVCLGFFTTDSLSTLFTMVVVYIARNLDGVFEDQKSYLIRLQKQENAEKGGF